MGTERRPQMKTLSKCTDGKLGRWLEESGGFGRISHVGLTCCLTTLLALELLEARGLQLNAFQKAPLSCA